jgi:hypothetical protein
MINLALHCAGIVRYAKRAQLTHYHHIVPPHPPHTHTLNRRLVLQRLVCCSSMSSTRSQPSVVATRVMAVAQRIVSSTRCPRTHTPSSLLPPLLPYFHVSPLLTHALSLTHTLSPGVSLPFSLLHTLPRPLNVCSPSSTHLTQPRFLNSLDSPCVRSLARSHVHSPHSPCDASGADRDGRCGCQEERVHHRRYQPTGHHRPRSHASGPS